MKVFDAMYTIVHCSSSSFDIWTPTHLSNTVASQALPYIYQLMYSAPILQLQIGNAYQVDLTERDSNSWNGIPADLSVQLNSLGLNRSLQRSLT